MWKVAADPGLAHFTNVLPLVGIKPSWTAANITVDNQSKALISKNQKEV